MQPRLCRLATRPAMHLIAGVSPKHRHRGQDLPQHPAGGLEASAEHIVNHLRPAILVPGAHFSCIWGLMLHHKAGSNDQSSCTIKWNPNWSACQPFSTLCFSWWPATRDTGPGNKMQFRPISGRASSPAVHALHPSRPWQAPLPAADCACLLQDPNPEDPLNKEAAVAFQENPRRFEGDVQRAIHYGHIIGGQHFPPCVRR